MKETLSRLFAEVLRELDANPGFRARIAQALDSAPNSGSRTFRQSTPRTRNRRDQAVLDPYQEFAAGEETLRAKLSSLTVEQLKDVVSEHAIDPSRLALKWKSSVRLAELIVDTVRARVEKGDVFRR